MAQHPIDVQKNANNKEYYKAMISFEKLPKQKINKNVLTSAAKSAWALSLPDVAVELFDKILENDDITNKEKATIYLYKGIIDFQEEKYSSSQVYAQKALELSGDDTNSLKSACLKLIGDNLFNLKLYGKAKEKYTEALKYAKPFETSSIYLQRGITSFYLGSFTEAQNDLKKVSMDNEDAPLAVRLVMKILLDKKDFNNLKKWLAVSNEEFPNEFIDSWVDYAKVKVAINDKDKKTAIKILDEAKEKFPQSDLWINLASASLETFLWEQGTKNKE
ncbi:MAG: tetratricopeptide repeat protein [Bdellovibrionota bacterium]